MAQDNASEKKVDIRFSSSKKKASRLPKNPKPPLGAMIICDGSFLEDKMCGGIAGTLRLIEPGKPYRDVEFNATVFGARSSVVVELYAISAGVQLLSNYAKKNGFHVKELHVFSDSKWGMGGYERMKNGESYYPAYTPGLKMLANALKPLGDMMPRFTHVKAHVSANNANRIERWHNEIDLRASKQSHEALAQLNRPVKGNAYGALLPAQVSPEKAVDLSNMGYALAKEGMFARVVFDGAKDDVTSHPFIDGVQKAADELGVPLSSVYHDSTEYKPKAFGQNGSRLRNGTMEDFAYRTIASGIATDELKREQKAAYNAGEKPRDTRRIVQPFRIQTNNNNAALAGEAVHLLHGENHLKKIYKPGDSPFNSLSQFVLDMSDSASPGRKGALNPTTRGDWLMQMRGLHEHAQIPVLNTVKAAFVSNPKARVHVMTDHVEALKDDLLSELEEYMDVLTPQQIAGKVEDILGRYDMKADEGLIKQAVNTNNATSPEKATSKIMESSLPSVFKHAHSMSDVETRIEQSLEMDEPTARRSVSL